MVKCETLNDWRAPGLDQILRLERLELPIGKRLLRFLSGTFEIGLQLAPTMAADLDAHGDASLDPIMCGHQVFHQMGGHRGAGLSARPLSGPPTS